MVSTTCIVPESGRTRAVTHRPLRDVDHCECSCADDVRPKRAGNLQMVLASGHFAPGIDARKRRGTDTPGWTVPSCSRSS